MITFNWNDVLQLPGSALAGDRRIPKTVLTRQALLTKTEQKILDKTRKLTHFATIQKSTTRIPPHVDESYDIQSILILHCEMAESAAYSEVARLLHKCFPNPTVILIDGSKEACISVATTRKSLAEKGAIVVEVAESTGGFYLADKAYKPFLNSLAFSQLSQQDLLAYLNDLTWNVRLSHGIPAVGFYPQCPEQYRDSLSNLLNSFGSLETKINNIVQKRRTDKSLTLNESAYLRIELKQLEKERDVVSREIREICNDRD